ncbi:MAG: 23S rRNA (pseudouridine(1915)-N(3))-methyltransferase RlmH [Clostridia bacterium]|nr:23S rRNA (pseudouridine(1915)-N(3))-methyltransferase RlmH [Clostridia bacterium]
MQITILCAGRLRERCWQEAAAEYVKRMGRYRKLEIIEVPDQPEGPQAMKKEGEAMLAHLRPDDYVVAMCIDGKEHDSLQLAAFFREREQLGTRVVFVIGGSLGLHEDVIRRADQRLSMSPMTFPHQLARIMLLEQIYRAHKINAGERYHK